MRYWLRSGDVLVAGLVIAPLILSWPRIAHTAGGVTGWLTIAHRAAAVLALSTFLTSAILSVRIPKIDRFFGGLTRLWRVHHVLGLASFLLVMAHALLVGLAALPASRNSAIPAMFPPFSAAAVWMGWIAFIALLAFLAPSFKFFGEPHYQRWKRLHLISAVALVCSFAHALPLTPDQAVWWVLGAIAAFAMIWRKVLSRFLACRPYTVVEARSLAAGVVELSLHPEGRPLRYEAGQFFYLTPYDRTLAAGYGEEHPYTASSAPQEGVLRIGIKELGDASNAIQRIQNGAGMLVEGPYGHFFERLQPNRSQLWLGGGIGITPFVGAVRAMRLGNRPPDGLVHLFYLADSAERAYYRAELLAATEGMASVCITPHYFQAEGPISLEFLRKHCPDFEEREVYICGPPQMAVHLKKMFRSCGMPRARVHSEDFNLL